MRRLFVVPMLLIMFPVLAVAQEQGWASKFFTGGLKHDFGNVPWGSQLSHKFTITNIYNVPFVVADAKVSCGCVTVKRPTGEIPPRGTAELEALLDTRKAGANGQPKIVTVFVTLRSVPQKAGEKIFTSACTLTVSCLSQANIRFSTDKIYFGAVNLGQSPKAGVTIEHFTNPGFEITGIAKNDHPVEVTYDKVQPQQGGRVGYRVNAALKPNAPAGEIKYEVQLTTNDKAFPVIDVVMEGTIKAALVASPNNVELGNVKTGEVVSGRVVLSGTGQAFKVLKVEGDGDGIKIKVPDKAASAHLIVIEFVPPKAGKVAKTITLKTDLPGDLSATFNVTGVGQ